MTKYSLDTNVLIDFLRGNPSVIKNMSNVYFQGDILAVSIIAYYEVVRGFVGIGGVRQLKKFFELCEALEPLYFDRYNMSVINNALKIYDDLRKNSSLIGENDIYIAATAMANDAVLVTDNIKHFSRIEGLRLVNWKE